MYLPRSNTLANTRAHGERSQKIDPHPNARYADRIQLIRWRRGPDNPTFEARFRLRGEKAWSKPVSLRTADPAEAADNARDELAKREAGFAPAPRRAAKEAEPARPERSFREVADEVLEELLEERAELVQRHGRGSGKVNTVTVHISTIGERLIPAFSDVPVAELDGERINTWARAQKVVARRGPDKGREAKPGKSTIGSWNHSLQKVLDRAVEKNWIKADNKPAMSQKGFEKAKPNPSFTLAEVEALRDRMTGAWVADGGKRLWEQGASIEVRYLLRAYVALATTTGIRPGEELELILPRQVVFGTERGRPTVSVPILAHQGKYGIERTAFVYLYDAFDAPSVLRGLFKWREERGAPKDSPLFALPSTGRCPNFAPPFKRLLEEVGILVDPKTGLERVPYSCRHYYATRAVLRGVSYEKLEKLMGTSAAMLRKHYDHADIMAHAAEVSGHGEKGDAERVKIMARRAVAREVRAPMVYDEQRDLDPEDQPLVEWPDYAAE